MIQMESEPQAVKDILDQDIVSIDMRRFENVNVVFPSDGEKPNFVPVKRPSEGRIYVTNYALILSQTNSIGVRDWNQG